MKNSLPYLRAAKQWSQALLADKLGVSRQTVNAIEREKYDPSLPLAFKVARLFNLTIEEVFDCRATISDSTSHALGPESDSGTPILVDPSQDLSRD